MKASFNNSNYYDIKQQSVTCNEDLLGWHADSSLVVYLVMQEYLKLDFHSSLSSTQDWHLLKAPQQLKQTVLPLMTMLQRTEIALTKN